MSTFPSPRCSVVGRGLEGVLGPNLGVVSISRYWSGWQSRVGRGSLIGPDLEEV